jgi:hypothetical protein
MEPEVPAITDDERERNNKEEGVVISPVSIPWKA